MSDASNRSRRAFLGGVGQVAAALVGGGLIAKVADAAPWPGDDNGARRMIGDDNGGERMIAVDGTAQPMVAGGACGLHDDLPMDADPAVLAFAGAVGPGTMLGEWRVARVHAVFRGALPFVLEHADGRRAQVDLMAMDGESPRGVAATRAGQLYLVNSGRGTATTPRDLEQAIGVLAERLGARSGAGLGLMSFTERHRCHPGGVFVVPV